MSKYEEIKDSFENYLKNENFSGISSLLEEEPKMVLDGYLKSEKYNTKFLIHLTQHHSDLLKNRLFEFSVDETQIKAFLLDNNLFQYLECYLSNSELELFKDAIKYSSIIFYDNCKTKWCKNLEKSQKPILKKVYKEIIFLNDFYLQIKNQVEQKTKWLQNIDWEIFLQLFVYELRKAQNPIPSYQNVVNSDLLFFLLQNKKTPTQNCIKSCNDFNKNLELGKKNLFKSKILIIDIESSEEYQDFKLCLQEHSLIRSAQHLLENYCFSDNINIDFLNNEIGRLYLNSVKKEAENCQNVLKYSYCSRFYNTQKNTPFENSLHFDTIDNYFTDLGFDINTPLQLKNGTSIKISILSKICWSLRQFNDIVRVLQKLENEKLTYEAHFKNLCSWEEYKNYLDFLATNLPFKDNPDLSNISTIPFFKIQDFYLCFPSIMLQTDFLTGLLNKIWGQLQNQDNKEKDFVDEQKKVADKQGENLKNLLEKHDFRAFAGKSFKCIDNKMPEFDLIAYKDNTLFLFEIKTTNFRTSQKGVHNHKTGAITKCIEQLKIRKNYIHQYKNEFERIFGKIENVNCFAVSNDFDDDHKCFSENENIITKISYFELLILLRNERHKLFDVGVEREKCQSLKMLSQEFSLLNNWHEQKGNKSIFYAWELFDENYKISAIELNDFLVGDSIWGEYLSDYWDFLRGEYISPNKELCIIRKDEKRFDITKMITNYNHLEKYLGENTHFYSQIPFEQKEQALISINDILNKFPNHTRALFHRGKLHQSLGKYQEAICDFEKIFELDFYEGVGINPFENSAFDNLMELYQHTKQEDKIMQILQKCVSTKGLYTHILFLAEYLLKKEDKEKAKYVFSEYLERVPGSDYFSILKAEYKMRPIFEV